MNLKRHIKNSFELRGAIIGMLMGDLCVSRKTEKHNAYFLMTHSKEQKKYMEFKSDILDMKDVVTMKHRSRETYLAKTGKTYEQYQCHSNNNAYATSIYEYCYCSGVKIVNEKILNSITDFGLFLWYLDDGYLNVRYYKNTSKIKEYRMFLYTMNFTLDEVKLIQKWFVEKYNINPNINRKQNGYILYFNASKTRQFMEIIEPFYNLVPCLNRKFLKEYVS